MIYNPKNQTPFSDFTQISPKSQMKECKMKERAYPKLGYVLVWPIGAGAAVGRRKKKEIEGIGKENTKRMRPARKKQQRSRNTRHDWSFTSFSLLCDGELAASSPEKAGTVEAESDEQKN